MEIYIFDYIGIKDKFLITDEFISMKGFTLFNISKEEKIPIPVI